MARYDSFKVCGRAQKGSPFPISPEYRFPTTFQNSNYVKVVFLIDGVKSRSSFVHIYYWSISCLLYSYATYRLRDYQRSSKITIKNVWETNELGSLYGTECVPISYMQALFNINQQTTCPLVRIRIVGPWPTPNHWHYLSQTLSQSQWLAM